MTRIRRRWPGASNATMRVALRIAAIVLLCSMFAPMAAAQAGASGAPSGHRPGGASTSTKNRKPAAAALRSECLDSVGLCVSVPAAWQRLGDVFEGLGFVAAEPHPGAGPETWPHLTVAAIDVSAKEGDGDTATASATPSLDALVERMLTPGGALASAHVLERRSLLLNGANAQIVRVGLPEEAGGAEAIEAVALIEGDAGLVYSVALRCSPPDFNRLEPVFQQALESWRLESAEGTSPAKPKPATAPGRTQPKANQSSVTQSTKEPASPAQ